MAGDHVEDALRLFAMPRHQMDSILAGDHHHDQQHLHHRHVDAHAQARAAAERVVGMPRPVLRSLRQESVGIEGLGVLPELGPAVAQVGAQQDGRAGRHLISANLVVMNRVARNHPDRRIQAQRFLQDPMRVRRAAAGRRPRGRDRRGRRQISRCSCRSTSGCCASRYQVQASDSPTVSCPCCSMPRISSCSCRAVIGAPVSSRAAMSIARKLGPVSPACCLRATSRRDPIV